MAGVDFFPGRRLVTALAANPQLVLVGFRVGVTVLAVARRRLVLLRGMTALAAHRRVLAFQSPAVFGLGIVVVEADLAGRVVACLAAEAQAAAVGVVF